MQLPRNQKMPMPEARYAYYRRCQEVRWNGEQCKAPAEKGARICHAHAGQRAMAERRGVERRAVLAAAAAKMRCSMADLLTSFNGIQVTIATAAQALIASRLDCKTARRLLWDLQRMAKLLELYHRAKAQTTKDTHSTPLSQAGSLRAGCGTRRVTACRIGKGFGNKRNKELGRE